MPTIHVEAQVSPGDLIAAVEQLGTAELDRFLSQVLALRARRRDRWRDHFVWNADFTLIVGLTPAGRATVEALGMNREGAVNLRRLLHAAGAHPPAEPDD